MSVAIGAGLLGLAAALLLPAGPHRAVRRLRSEAGPRAVARRDPVWPIAGGAAMLCIVVAWVFAGTTGAVFAVCVASLGLTAVRVVRVALRERVRLLRSREVTEAGEVLAGMLRLGNVPAQALAAASAECPALREAAAALLVGGDPAEVLDRCAGLPGYHDLARVAAGWRIATATGASMTSTMDAIAAQLRAGELVAGLVRAELSAPRATGRILAVLPVAGLLLGYFVGGDPVGFLTRNWVGELCLVGGVWLMCAGLLWTDALADRAAASR